MQPPSARLSGVATALASGAQLGRFSAGRMQCCCTEILSLAAVAIPHWGDGPWGRHARARGSGIPLAPPEVCMLSCAQHQSPPTFSRGAARQHHAWDFCTLGPLPPISHLPPPFPTHPSVSSTLSGTQAALRGSAAPQWPARALGTPARPANDAAALEPHPGSLARCPAAPEEEASPSPPPLASTNGQCLPRRHPTPTTPSRQLPAWKPRPASSRRRPMWSASAFHSRAASHRQAGALGPPTGPLGAASSGASGGRPRCSWHQLPSVAPAPP